jgi:hypothetical protein
MENSELAILRFKIGNGGWSSPPEEIWKKILETYLFEIGDSFAIRGIVTEDDLYRKTIFNFVDRKDIRYLRVRDYEPGSISITHDPETYRENIGLFEITVAAKRAISFAPFGRWTVDADFMGVKDELIFFSGPNQISMTVESDVIFFNLGREYYNLLCAADPLVASNLWTGAGLKSLYRPN